MQSGETVEQSANQTVMALKPLQAVSGAGYPGVPSYDILDNAIPFVVGGPYTQARPAGVDGHGKERDSRPGAG